MANIDRPTKSDAVLGTQNLISNGSFILGGIEGVKKRLNSDSIHVKILALKDAMNYGNVGLHLAIEYLEDEESQIVEAAYSLLELRPETFVRERIDRYLDDRELELQDMKYSLLESNWEDGDRQPTKKSKGSKNIESPKTKPRASIEVSKHHWDNAS